MNLPLSQRLLQLKVLLDNKIITPEDYEKRRKAMEAGAPPTPAQASRATGEQRSSERFTTRRPDASAFLRAPYRFVPYHADVLVHAEKAALGSIHEPIPDGLCAEIEVEWEAEGPLLVGQEENGLVTPMRWPGETKGGYFIPGSTLRGAIRSVCEIIGGGRLAKAHVNLAQSFALRDFTHRAYSNSKEDVGGDARYPLADIRQLKAGWLKLKDGAAIPSEREDPALLTGKFEIVPAPKWYRIEAESIWRADKPRGTARDAKDFTKKTFLEKYAALGLVRREGNVEVPTTSGKTYRFQRVGSENEVIRHEAGSIEGYYAFSGKSPSGKRFEYVIATEDKNESEEIQKADEPEEIRTVVWERFVRAHSQAVKDKLKPDGAWKDVPKLFRADPTLRLPVFFVGDLKTQDPASFAFGITRLFKVPHARSLLEVLEKSGVEDPMIEGQDKVDTNKLDIVDALFGYVYETENPDERDTVAARDVARKGRVAFSAAKLVRGEAQVSATVETVMMAPRPSFAPFYLKGVYKDYSAPTGETVTIAGRKRYPVRQTKGTSALASFQAVRGRLAGQIDAIKAMNPQGKGPGPDVVTRLQFLLPRVERENLVFRSHVRLTNVTKAELGLVLDALTLGGKSELRHCIGRAKPFGAGQVNVSIKKLRVERNDTEGVALVDAAGQADYIAAWKDHRKAELRKVEQGEKHYDATRLVFEACCNPEVGASLDRKGLLDYLRLREQPAGANRAENPYVRLREMVKPMKGAAPPAADAGALLKIP